MILHKVTVPNKILLLQFISIIDTIYNLDWINYPVKVRRHLIFTMQSLNMPRILTIFGTIKLDLTFFVGVRIYKLCYKVLI